MPSACAPPNEQYAAAYFELRDAMKAAAAARIEMEALLAAEGLELPQSGAPEGRQRGAADGGRGVARGGRRAGAGTGGDGWRGALRAG